MKILLVYPETPVTFWSFTNALKIISKKAAEPPLGLITVAAMLPQNWDIKLIDMNVSPLLDDDIRNADYVFLSGMSVQINSFREVIKRCNIIGTKIVAGGPLVTIHHEDFLGIDHFVLNEAEVTLPIFLKDLKEGRARHIYSTDEFPDITTTPVPRFDLLDRRKYAGMSLQYSRGCPYDCEFCSITMLNGRKPRTKTAKQFINELDTLYNLGWRGGISIVDDNFIGNKNILKNELLPALINWLKLKKFPFSFGTEVSINLADDKELMGLMVSAGFDSIFVGIETPNTSSLSECGKNQNLKRDLINSVSILQQNGLMVSGGFIVGFDNDPENIFDQQIEFINKSAIVTAMVGILNAPKGTKLFNRLKSENRLLEHYTGNNTDGSINFIPKMNYAELIKGYSKILSNIYSQKEYYERLKKFLIEYQLPKLKGGMFSWSEVKIFFKLTWRIGITEKGKKYFWKLFAFTIFKQPRKFVLAMTMAVYGFHFRKVVAAL
jgi:radical SAM superfamily enzyme YgiQ (UPF0313 family)